MKVTKFGGSSLADATQIKKVCEILTSDPERRVIVVSAPGKRNSSDIKVTDLLIALANAKISGQPGNQELEAVLNRFSSICEELDILEVMDSIKETITESVSQPVKDASRFMDATKALGEKPKLDSLFLAITSSRILLLGRFGYYMPLGRLCSLVKAYSRWL